MWRDTAQINRRLIRTERSETSIVQELLPVNKSYLLSFDPLPWQRGNCRAGWVGMCERVCVCVGKGVCVSVHKCVCVFACGRRLVSFEMGSLCVSIAYVYAIGHTYVRKYVKYYIYLCVYLCCTELRACSSFTLTPSRLNLMSPAFPFPHQVIRRPPVGSDVPGLHAIPGARKPRGHAARDQRRSPGTAHKLPRSRV